jgi:FOG: LysM repeat
MPGVPPTNSPRPMPTDTITPTEISTDLPISIICVKSFYWPTYLVQAGDWLSSIAAATGTSVNALMVANCLSNDRIYAGQVLYVPRPPATITAIQSVTSTAMQTPTVTATYTATNSQTPTLTITSTNTFTVTPTYTSSPPPTATNSPPQVSIRSPSNGSGYPYDGINESNLWYTNVELIGSASDIEDDVLSDSSLAWTTDRNDIQDPFLGNGSTLKTTLYSNVCGGEWHTITFTGVDSKGAVATATIKFFLGESHLC